MSILLDKKEFKTLDTDNKIKKLIDVNRKILMTISKMSNYIYLFDSKDKLHIIPIKNPKFLGDADFKGVFRDIIKSNISDLDGQNVKIVKLLYFINGYFDTDKDDLSQLNLDEDFNKHNANESFIAYYEDKFTMHLEVYDKISIQDEGNTFLVISENPIKKLTYSKLDIDDNLKGALTNIIR